MKNWQIFILINFIIVSCSFEKTVTISFNDIEGISEEDEVMIKGIKVGEVEDLEVNNQNKILVKISLEKDLPNDSKFYSSKTDLFGGTGLVVEEGISQKVFAGGEILNGYYIKGFHKDLQPELSPVDSTFTKELNNILKSQENKESFLKEVKDIFNNPKK